jgi:AraC-like DNA-binding protein
MKILVVDFGEDSFLKTYGKFIAGGKSEYLEQNMTCNPDDIFLKADELLSEKPEMRLWEMEKHIGCSHPTIRNAIFKHSSLGYREYQKRKLVEKAMALLQRGRNVKVVALELGYKWPENFTRFSRKAFGCSASKIKVNL